MRKFLERVWAGVVGAVAGASLGFVAVIVLVMQKVSLDTALWVVVALAISGGIAALAFGNRGSADK